LPEILSISFIFSTNIISVVPEVEEIDFEKEEIENFK
jgi:hypothetical protein